MMEKGYIEAKKDLYCPTCKSYPDEIREVYDWAVEKRVWNNDCYELEDIDYGNSHSECAKCNSLLESRIQEETDEPKLLPKVSGEISEDKDIFPKDGSYNDKK